MLLYWIFTTDKSDQNHDNSNNKKNVDEIADSEYTNDSQKPENQKNNCDCC